MKKIIFYLTMCLGAAWVAVPMTSCNDKPEDSNVRVTGVSLDRKTLALNLVNAKTAVLSATVLPAEATNKKVEWSSSDPSVVIASGGTVVALTTGTAIVTVTTEDGSFQDSCVVTVDANGSGEVTGVSLDREEAYLSVGEETTLTADVSPASADNKKVTWESGDTAVATVSATGLVKALAIGTTTVTVTTDEGNHTAECVVRVVNAVTGIALKWDSATLEVDDTYTMTATVTPADASVKELTWTSTDGAVATVTKSGEVTGMAKGQTTITATAVDGSGVTASYVVTVMTKPTMTGCFDGTPRWGETLGEISFKSDRTWKLGDLLWSDVVLSSVCSVKTSYQGRDGGMSQNYCDCRAGNSGYGDFFSWCAAARFRKELCPDGWRLPAAEDFVALDIALGGPGVNRPSPNPSGPYGHDTEILPKYLNDWGGAYGGNVTWNNTVQTPGIVGYYWSRSIEAGMPDYGMYMGIQNNGTIYVNYSSRKEQGFPIRCVR